nr:hypothetical protein [uncultured Desulfobacter sp.]
MHLDGKEIIEKNKIGEVTTHFLDCSVDELKQCTDTAILNAPEFKKGDEEEDTGIEFVHKSFGEYLSAEKIAKKIEEIHEQVTIEITGKTKYSVDDNKVIEILTEILCIRPITDEVYEFLETFLGTFTEYSRSLKGCFSDTSAAYENRLIRLLERLEKRYVEAINGSDIPLMHRKLMTLNQSHNVQICHYRYVMGLLKMIVKLHKRLNKKFFLYKGLEEPKLLHAILLLFSSGVQTHLTKEDMQYVTALPRTALNDSKTEYITGVSEALRNEAQIIASGIKITYNGRKIELFNNWTRILNVLEVMGNMVWDKAFQPRYADDRIELGNLSRQILQVGNRIRKIINLVETIDLQLWISELKTAINDSFKVLKKLLELVTKYAVHHGQSEDIKAGVQAIEEEIKDILKSMEVLRCDLP